jgi:hypothetical protein
LLLRAHLGLVRALPRLSDRPSSGLCALVAGMGWAALFAPIQ